jgi:hypothetical protein
MNDNSTLYCKCFCRKYQHSWQTGPNWLRISSSGRLFWTVNERKFNSSNMFWRVERKTVTGVLKNCKPSPSGSHCTRLLCPEEKPDTTLQNISDIQTTRRHIQKDLNFKKHHWDNLKSRMTMKLGLSGDEEFLAQMSDSKLHKGYTSTSLGVTWSNSFRTSPRSMLWW